MNLPKQDSATGRGIKTGIQAIIGFAITFVVGLVMAIKGVPGCPEAVISYIGDNFVQIAMMLGVSSGAASFVWNYFRPKVSTY